jgi:hypothetical protein
MWYIYTMEFCSAIKKNDTMSFFGKWMELEIIMLNDTSHSEKGATCFLSFVKSTGKKSRS